MIASRQAVPRRALTRFLETRPELNAVGEAANEGELMTQVKPRALISSCLLGIYPGSSDG